VKQFAVYETIKKVLTARKGSNGKEQKLSSLEAFLLGAFAKWIATVATYPLQVSLGSGGFCLREWVGLGLRVGGGGDEC
jgi:hypothetical protein